MSHLKSDGIYGTIKSDGEAPILRVADYALLAELFETVPEFDGTI